jgi:16S rRNA (uracil1498-N3)-methyltransferase
MARKIRVPISGLSPGERPLERESAHYLLVVHRLCKHDGFVAFDPVQGLEADAIILDDDPPRARCLLEAPRPARVSGANVKLVLAVVKTSKLEAIAQAAVALGAVQIVLVWHEHSSLPKAALQPKRVERLRTLLREAARQCLRGDLPELVGPLGWDSWLKQQAGAAEHKLVLHPGASSALLDALAALPRERSLTVLIGPEGGHSAGELRALEGAGFQAVRLGQFVLRVELAAVAALSVVCAWAEAPVA